MTTPANLPATRRKPPLLGPIVGLVGTVALLLGIALTGRPSKEPPISSTRPVVRRDEPRPTPAVVAAPSPAPAAPRPIEPDRAAIARAEADLDAATNLRAAAENRLADAEIALKKATIEAATEAAAVRALGSEVKDPTARIERVINREARARWEIKKIGGELASLAKVPRPKAKALIDQNAVAKPIDGKEYHFEVRGDRVAFIDVDALTDLIKADVRLRLRMNLRNPSLSGTVGPIGEFSMHYVMGPSMGDSSSGMLDPRELALQFRGWEIRPERDVRGETYETAWQPTAAFARTINRLNPSSSSVTFWIYPAGFPLYRRLREDLHARGFLVAARPLPDDLTIRGSPAGSLSAGQ